jgi:hypothetical protein
MPAMLAVLSLTACSGAPAKTPAAAAQPAPTSTAAQPAMSPAHTTAASDGTTVTGPVAETMNSGGYTYARLTTDKGEVWIAAAQFAVKTGERLTVPLEMPMANFHSQTLNRDFPMIYFVAQVARDGQPLSPAQQPSAPPVAASSQSAATSVERIPPAPGGMSIADVWAKRTTLAGQQVVVRGKVVKVNSGILDRNWVHLQDGSGSATNHTNDLVVTTAANVSVGDIVTLSGVLGIGKDFGAGYAYDAILEKAIVKQ